MSTADPSTSQTSYAFYDERRWPIVVVRPPEVPFDETAFAEHCQQIVAYFERGQDFAFVVDVRHAAPVEATYRRALAGQLDRCMLDHPNIRHYTALIIASAVQRGIVKAIGWLSGQPSQTRVFAALDDGIAWCKTLLAEREAERQQAPS